MGCEEALQPHVIARTFGRSLPPGQPPGALGFVQRSTPGSVLPSSLTPTLGLHLQACLYCVGKAVFHLTQLLDVNSW